MVTTSCQLPWFPAAPPKYSLYSLGIVHFAVTVSPKTMGTILFCLVLFWDVLSKLFTNSSQNLFEIKHRLRPAYFMFQLADLQILEQKSKPASALDTQFFQVLPHSLGPKARRLPYGAYCPPGKPVSASQPHWLTPTRIYMR